MTINKAILKETVPPHPKQTGDLLGHTDAEVTLRHAWESGRLPHAWLITGLRGIGKATLAYRMATFALCDQLGKNLTGDLAVGLHVPLDAPEVRDVAMGSHPDLYVLEPGQRNPDTNTISHDIVVGQVRQASHFCFMTPARAAWRVIVVDPADEMTSSAANALLKLLEEPPPQALLLLISHAPARLLPTIRSRCAQLALSPLPDREVQTRLQIHRPDIPDTDAAILARLAEGSIGIAFELARAGGLDLYRDLIALLGGMPRIDADRLHAFAEKMSQGGEAGTFRLGTRLLQWWIGRMTRAGAIAQYPSPIIPEETSVMQHLLSRVALEQWLELWEKIGHLAVDAEQRHLDRKQVVLTLFLEIEALTA